ncbi:hypothetical protein Afil01_67730 [Actinorhabdospora filicis]|uniref:Lipoprotein n=1 Tax=Actinorhabdospora filicis TaxID=1785913 RepID=A0A9W6WDU7_9ACTN|nr:hypothetical protein [Actinorhabdospora filicis]GLZ81966.1 hypothetical protein Afil01_67730 [Actinorhabdospora filicis]
MAANTVYMRIRAVVSAIALITLTACTSGPTGGGDDVDGVDPDPYTQKIATCLSPEDAPHTGEPLDGEAGPARTADGESGVSYRAYPDPWRPFVLDWKTQELGLSFHSGQMLEAEVGVDGTPNWAVIGSTRMPTNVGDAVVTDLACLGALVVADIIDMTGYESGAASTDVLRQELRTIDGRPAWLNLSRYHVIDERFSSRSELQGTLLIDGDKGAAIVFVTVPGVRDDLDGVIDEVFASVRVP